MTAQTRFLGIPLFLALAVLPARSANPVHHPREFVDFVHREEAADQLILINQDPRLRLTMHPPGIVIAGDGRQPFLFCTAAGTLLCQAQLNAPPFNTKHKMVYHDRLATAISRDRGATWTRWTAQPNHDDVNIEGGVVQLADGTILLLDTYVIPSTEGPGRGVGELWVSHDDLRTIKGPTSVEFSLPGILFGGSTDDNGETHAAARLHRSIVLLPDGDLLTTMYTRFAGDDSASGYLATMMKARTIVIRSHDRGATWAYLSTVGIDGGVGTEGYGEPVLVRVPPGPYPGRLLCLMRTGRELYGSHSDDSGATWSRPLPIPFPGIDLYATETWASRYYDTKAPGYFPHGDMIGAEVNPDLIAMQDGTLVCTLGVRIPSQKFAGDWHVPRNGDYLAFSCDGGDTWSEVVQFRSGAPTTQYMGVREISPGLLYVVHDDSVWHMPGSALGFQLEVKRLDR